MSNEVGRSARRRDKASVALGAGAFSFFSNADCSFPVPSTTTMRFVPRPRAMMRLGRTNAAAMSSGRRMVMMMNIFRRTACRYSRLRTANNLFMRPALWRAPRQPLQENAEVAGIAAGMNLGFVVDLRRLQLEHVRRIVRRRVDFVRAREMRLRRLEALDDRAVQLDRQRRLRRHQLVGDV